jgi:hypothetical protein
MTQAGRVFGSRNHTETYEGHAQDMKYSSWQEPYLDAMLEMKPNRLKDRVASAEAAIQLRLRELADSPESQLERQCLADARNGLVALEKETSAPPSNHGASRASTSCQE